MSTQTIIVCDDYSCFKSTYDRPYIIREVADEVVENLKNDSKFGIYSLMLSNDVHLCEDCAADYNLVLDSNNKWTYNK